MSSYSELIKNFERIRAYTTLFAYVKSLAQHIPGDCFQTVDLPLRSTYDRSEINYNFKDCFKIMLIYGA